MWADIESCVNWLAPLAITIREANIPVFLKQFDHVMADDQQNIQTHDVTMEIMVSSMSEHNVIYISIATFR